MRPTTVPTETVATICTSARAGEVLERALCAEVDTDIFFPPKGGTARAALRVCAACPVREDCLQLALDLHADGIWGGTTVLQRRDLQRERARTAAA